jgi:hypothetical protein
MEDLNYQINVGEGIQKVNADGRGLAPFYFKQSSNSKSKNPKLKNFRLGEIIQGKILSLVEKGVGVVRLPNGNFTCHLHPGLLADDELFFRIAEVEPSLVLKVHSVQSHIRGKKRKKEDIIRILDLPDEDLYLYTCDLFLTFKNMIYKDDLLRFFKFYSKVPKNEQFETDSFSRALFWLAESGLPFEYDIFEITYKYFNSLKSIDELQQKLFNQYFKLLPESLNKMTKIFLDNFNGFVNENNFKFGYYSMNYESDDFCFFKLISKISGSPISATMENVPELITEFIEAMHIWNNICSTCDSAYHWTFPFNLKGKTKLITMVFRSQFNIQNISQESASTNPDIDIGITLNEIFRFIGIDFIEEINSTNSLDQLSLVLGKYMSQTGLLLLALHYADESGIHTIESPTGATISTNKSISFVI